MGRFTGSITDHDISLFELALVHCEPLCHRAHMTYDLLIGDRSYSSWSLRGWLLFEAFGIPVNTELGLLYDDDVYEKLKAFAPAKTVPAVRTPDGAIWTDSIAIAEGLNEAHPDKGYLPAAPAARALARSLMAEMHSGFSALRGACPMNMRLQWTGFTPSDAVLADLARLDLLWSLAREHAGDGPWLFGSYGAVDAFFAPVAMRIAGYDLSVSDAARAYVDAHLAHPPLRRWRAQGEADDRTLDVYDQGLPTAPFPIEAP